MALAFAKHERISIRNHPDFSEVWLHERICEDTAMLGLGELDVVDRERPQIAGGRLDMLLADSEANARYEVEIMLGATDPSHLIRCIEYWDIERRRYPAYDHVAVLVAEEVTSRFLNVMALLSGSIPMIAIQLNALKNGENLVLDFVRVLDQRDLREEDNGGDEGPMVDRQWWEGRKGTKSLQICDQLLQLANEKATRKLELRYTKSTVSIGVPGAFFRIVQIWPKKELVRLRLGVSNANDWATRLDEAGISATAKRVDRLIVRLTAPDLHTQKEHFGGDVEVRLTTAMQWPSVCQSSVQLMDNEVAGVLVSSENGDLGALQTFPLEADAEAVHIVMGSQIQCGMAEEWNVIDQSISLSEGQRD